VIVNELCIVTKALLEVFKIKYLQRRNNMRKIIVLSMISLDGVMQAPGGPKEDPSGGFKFGGWVAPYSDEVYAEVVQKELRPADYLLGRKTFEMLPGFL
jgi:hypothetical protein